MDSARTERRKPRKLMKVDESLSSSEYVRNNRKYWNEVFHKMDTYQHTVENESKILAEVLPKELYKKVCASLNLPRTEIEEPKPEGFKVNLPRRTVKEPQISTRKCLYVNRELDSDTDVEFCPSDDEEEKPNIYLDMLNKPVREQITWPTRYLQPEKEDEKSLVKKADDLTDRIANEFCEYMKQLGGDQQSKLFTPKAIKELFQIEFDTHVAQSLSVVPKELPCVEDKIANVTGNPTLSRYATLNREITKDIKAEHRTPNLKAFTQSLPMPTQYHPPQNNTKKQWRSTRHVPKELVTLKTVWEGITNLRSVKEYCRWMIHHPEHRRPPYLTSLGLFDPAVLDARLTFESEYQITPPIGSPHEPPEPIENIRTRVSDSIESE
ncbi:uncharacterized protein LOC111358536 [Spodoptera litura]|uniref:Uncharacterized protein LOC111358536 n=1 Tax=Spodoptera litura TaxID=69820 RepID=A0A9J7IXT0_SPOLT|nr:uncharacterized protein LOC111358536 [Spodoptera litura]